MKEQFEKLREIVLSANRLCWSGGGRYLGPINPFGIATQTPGPKFTNWFILAELVPTIHLGEGFEDFPPRTEGIVLVGLNGQFEFDQWEPLSKTLGGITADTSRDGTIKGLIKPPRPSRFTWTLLYPDPSLVIKELRPMPPEIETLCQIIEYGTKHHRHQRIEALNKLLDSKDVGRDFMPELHARLNPMIGQAEDMGVEYFMAATLANLGDRDENIVREISFHLSAAKSDGGGIWEAEHVDYIRCHAIRALSNVRHSDTVIILRRCLKDESADVRKAVIWALGALGEEDGREDLELIRDQGDGEERWAAQAALELFGTSSYDQIHSRSKELDQQAHIQKIPIGSVYIHREGQQLGPYAFDQVKAWLAAGQLRDDDLAHYEGASAWMPLSAVPGIDEQ